MIVPSCDCARRSSCYRVYTCPVCVGKALVMMDREVAQLEMFPYIDSGSSVSALSRGRGELTPIADVLEGVLDDLPF